MTRCPAARNGSADSPVPTPMSATMPSGGRAPARSEMRDQLRRIARTAGEVGLDAVGKALGRIGGRPSSAHHGITASSPRCTPGRVADLADRQQGTVDVRLRARSRVMRKVQALAGRAEHGFDTDHVAGQTHRVDLHAIKRRTARFTRPAHLIERHAGMRRLDLAEPESEFARRAGRCVRLVLVRVVDDFEVIEVTRGDLRKPLQQHDREREVAAGEHAAPAGARDAIDLDIVLVAQSGRANHHMGARFEGCQNVRLGAYWLGELDEHVARGRERCGRGGMHRAARAGSPSAEPSVWPAALRAIAATSCRSLDPGDPARDCRARPSRCSRQYHAHCASRCHLNRAGRRAAPSPARLSKARAAHVRPRSGRVHRARYKFRAIRMRWMSLVPS